MHTSLDVDTIRADKDDLLLVGGSHVVMNVDGIVGCGALKEVGTGCGCVGAEEELS